jgi:hypothetical protein
VSGYYRQWTSPSPLITGCDFESGLFYNQLTLAKIIVERYRSLLISSTCTTLYLGVFNGHSEVVQWLLGEMKLSHDDRVTWLLATASARGDIDTVKLLTAQTASQAIHDTSHALRYSVLQW